MEFFQFALNSINVRGRETAGGRSLASQARHKMDAPNGLFASRIVVTTPHLP